MRKAIPVLTFAIWIAAPVVFAQTAPVSADATQAQIAQSRKPLSPIGRALASLLSEAAPAPAPTQGHESIPSASAATAKTNRDHALPIEVDATAAVQPPHRDLRAAPTELAATTHP